MSTSEFISAKHWSEIDRVGWDKISPYFSPKELASKGDGSLLFSKEALVALNKLREKFGKPLIVNSAYRDEAHNRKVGGGKNSQHKLGTAVDIHIDSQEMGQVLEGLAKSVGFKGIGRYKTFIHVDARETIARWGSWDASATADA